MSERLRIGTCVIARSDHYVDDLKNRRGVVVKDETVSDNERDVHVYLFPDRKRSRSRELFGTFAFTRAELTPTRCRAVEAQHVRARILESKRASQKSREVFAVAQDAMMENLPRGRRRSRR